MCRYSTAESSNAVRMLLLSSAISAADYTFSVRSARAAECSECGGSCLFVCARGAALGRQLHSLRSARRRRVPFLLRCAALLLASVSV